MEIGPFEDVFPIEHGNIPWLYVSLPEGNDHEINLPNFGVEAMGASERGI